MSREIYIPAFAPGKSPHPSPYISYGIPYPEACVKHVSETFHASRVYILASGALSRNTSDLPSLVSALESKMGKGSVVGIRKGILPHSHYSDILEVVKEAKTANTDILVTLGGGSLTDAAKVITLALANNATTSDELETLYFDSPTLRDPLLPATVPIICIPTALCAGEYNPVADATNDETKHKQSFQHLSIGPRLVILSPELSTTTPMHIWLSTGVRAVDHCVEAICSIASTDEGDANAAEGLRKLVPALLATKQEPGKLEPRMQCLLGAKDAIGCNLMRIPMGASHGIGHQLGPLGVGHGETSCVLMPAVMRFNKSVNSAKQREVLKILWGEVAVEDVLVKRGVEREGADLADVLDAIFRELDLPRSLKEVGVGRDKLPALSQGSLSYRWCKSNPVPLMETEQVMEILKMVVGEQ
ncbi:MAG: hypothetical protein ALECFALPRED_000236 [Alectoria fallacina]|uniref:Alcohol dehydrogenase iron-type/glycerol dehydrogenase GldA domain-containing protein n=1 Tax=Alectoria fallacina TaxID=1903189 RepID=A0A8H3F8H4_9LECA|nr:MAG: hypothetical protein ALECFALPRED_000236 [Alectoria fallacina]